ncbi:MAG: contractile injection system tape measure protein [Sphingomonas sp.]
MESVVAKGDGPPSSPGTGLNGALRCGQSVRVANAGLVILSPYLPALFDRAGILDLSAAQLQVTDIPKALRLLKYLAYGEAKPPDQGLELNKVLCGVSCPQPAETSLALEKRDLGLCDDLMAAALSNWKASGQSSTALRETFLQRHGELTQEANGFRLTVERKVLDVLLESVPWSFTDIKHPWMLNLLHVEW